MQARNEMVKWHWNQLWLTDNFAEDWSWTHQSQPLANPKKNQCTFSTLLVEYTMDQLDTNERPNLECAPSYAWCNNPLLKIYSRSDLTSRSEFLCRGLRKLGINKTAFYRIPRRGTEVLVTFGTRIANQWTFTLTHDDFIWTYYALLCCLCTAIMWKFQLFEWDNLRITLLGTRQQGVTLIIH